MKKKVMSLTLGLIFVLQMILPAGLVFAADAPAVVSVTPSGDNVDKATVGKITFSTSMDRSTLNSTNIVVRDVTNGEVMTQTESSTYDTSYVFKCDFQPNTQYTVMVTPSVKSADGTAAALYSHTFKTGSTVYGVKDITPKDVASYEHNVPSNRCNTTIDCIFDGDTAGGWYAWGDVYRKYIQIDLGKACEIAYINYFPSFKAEDSPFWGNDIKIQASLTGESWDDLATTPTLTSDENYKKAWNVLPDNDTEYQYIKLSRISDTRYLSCAEIEIYGYDYGAEVVEAFPQGENLTKVKAGKITFDRAMDRSTLNSTNIVVTDVTNNAVLEQKSFTAFENEYTFVCDFKSNTEYKVSVSKNVKDSSGLAAVPYEYTFKTGNNINGVVNVTPKNEDSYTIVAGKTFGDLSRVYDDDTSALWNTAGTTKPASITADLGEEKEIAYISYYGKRIGDNDEFINNMFVQVSKDGLSWTDLAVAPTFETGVNSGLIEIVAVNTTNEKYQYVRLTRASNVIYVVELTTYAYEENPKVIGTSFGENGVENVNYTKMMRIDFDKVMDRYTLTSENIIVKDEAGNVTAQTVSQGYDKAYVFSCDFEAKTTYTVTVTTAVKTLNGTPFAENVEYSFTTGHIAPVKNVTPMSDSAYTVSGVWMGTYSGDAEKSIQSAIYTGGPNDQVYTYSEDDAWIQTDLGDEYPISYISYLPRNVGSVDQFRSDRRGSKILVSNDPEFKTYKELSLVPEFYDDEAFVKGVYWNCVTETNGESYRYVRVVDKGYVFISELKVYAYQEKTEEAALAQVAKTDEYALGEYEIWGDVIPGEKITFALDLQAIGEAASPKVYAAVYGYNDANNRVLVSIVEATANTKGNAYSVTASIPKGLKEAEVDFFIWDGGMIPLTGELVRRNF